MHVGSALVLIKLKWLSMLFFRVFPTGLRKNLKAVKFNYLLKNCHAKL